MLNKNHLLGVGITNATEDKILEYILQRLNAKHEKNEKTKPLKKFFVVTPNPEILVYASKHPQYKKMLNYAEVALPDGVGVFVASGLMGHKFKERIPGVDFIETLCKGCVRKPISMGFLGGRPGVAKRTAECLMAKYPWIKVRWAGSEWENEISVSNNKHSDTDNRHDIPWVSPYISQDDPIDILFVAFGFPKQEEWIIKHLHELPVKSAMGVGGAFDYISGEVLRAPFMIRAIGLEWLFRLSRQPWRLKRQIALIEFIYLIIKERLKKK